jgi:hypothetical protein
MKKYYKPNIYTGIDAIYFISIGLETWCKYKDTSKVVENKPQMVMAAKILHAYCFQQKFKDVLITRINHLVDIKLERK